MTLSVGEQRLVGEFVGTIARADHVAVLLAALPLNETLRAITLMLADQDIERDAAEIAVLRRQRDILAVLRRAADELKPYLLEE